ncbi:Hypothetical protein LUCI_4257 [Lucifera butyrica]|uniref:Major facilitator superfamily (MFS) profile domain-containing protein n=1 Tax=Lucifera butyrica TaxID=1351585 RepID=A0A498RC57_9FIRM|nr:MFS transporter [Lucifera butyrica]VBB08971.1 Hypothetical protein LUCI_4257 [Lucifera butyrica]
MKLMIHNTAAKLIAIRGLRSIGQGAMVVDLTLYLKDLQWSGSLIGSVTSAAGLFGALLILLVGILSDRFGRKRFLVLYELITFFSALWLCFTTQTLVLILAIVITGFGRGQSGAAGPFSPAEQAWLSCYAEQSRRGQIFSLNTAVGFAGMALGAVIGGLPGLYNSGSPLLAYRPVFFLIAVISLLCTVILLSMQDRDEPAEVSVPGVEQRPEKKPGANPEKEHIIWYEENWALLKLALVNSLNGLAIGLTGPMMAYWFSLRFEVSTQEIGLMMAAGFFLTGMFAVINGFLAERFGMVKSVSWMRVAGSLLMLILPWVPSFTLASLIYIMRNSISRGTQGNRSALTVSLTRESRRGLAASINALSNRLPSAVGPTITGYLFDAGQLSLPLTLTAVMQLISAGLYQRVFGGYDKQKV